MTIGMLVVGSCAMLGFLASTGSTVDARAYSLPVTLMADKIVAIEPSRTEVSESFAYNLKHGLLKRVPGKDLVRQAFDYNGGQFEVQIPKASFPIPAPNCKTNVLLRAPGVNPDKANAQEKLEARWQLFQAIHDVADGKRASIEVPVEVKHSPGFAPYMILDAHGKPTLEWCNAFIDTKALNAPQTGKSKQ